MVIGTFGIGFAAGVVTTQLTDPEAAMTASGQEPAATQLDPLLQEPALGLEQEAAVAFVPGTWLGDTAGSPPDDAVAVPDEPPASIAARLSATEMLEALPSPARIAARALPAALSSEAASSHQARLAKGSLLDRAWSTEQILVRRGDTLMNILLRARIDQSSAHAAVASLRDVYDPRRLRAGQQLALTAPRGAEDDRRGLLRLAFDLDFDHQIEITRGADCGYAAAKVERP